MDIYLQKLEQLDKTLQKNGLGYIYNFLSDRDNGLILPFFAVHMDSLNKMGLDFSVTTDTIARAGIIYKENLVFLSYGLVDKLSKLAELIYVSGALNGLSKDVRYQDLHFVENPFIGFNGKDVEFGNGQLYLYIFDKLLQFIVSHEVGHFLNDHGKRLSNKNNILDDVEGHRKIASKDLISSHARELVADLYAFNNLLDYVEKSIDTQKSSLIPLFSDKNGPVILTTLIIACYFQMMDGSNGHDHFTSTHPEAAMRACAIMATYSENLKEDSINEIFSTVISLLAKVFSVLEVDFKFDWGSRMASPEMKEWHLNIYNEYSKWVKN